jgi:hypothetical protein
MAQNTCEAAKRLPVSFLKLKGYLRATYITGSIKWTHNGQPSGDIGIAVNSDNTSLRAFYTSTDRSGEKTELDYQVPMTRTRCHFGGWRYWLLCPLIRNGSVCNNQVGILYLEGKYLGCRRCHNLSYESQQTSYSGKWSVLRTYFALETKISEAEEKTRVKYWKGQPTKRYRKILKAYAQMERLSPAVAGIHF